MGAAAAMRGLRGGVRVLAWPSQRGGAEPRHGDRAQTLTPTGNVPCTNFKAPRKSNPLLQTPNHLFYSQEGMLGYQDQP